MTPWGNDAYVSAGQRLTLRNGFTWQLPFSKTYQAEFKAGHTRIAAASDSTVSFDALPGGTPHRENLGRHSETIGTSYRATLRSDWGDGHKLSLGVESKRDATNEQRVDLIDGASQLGSVGQRFDAGTWSTAAFAHDEWKISNAWSTDLGLRWEQMNQSTASEVQPATQFQNATLAPVAQVAWASSAESKDEVRLALTRSWRAPELGMLSGATVRSADNSLARPDVAGNPKLRPELATGLDLSYTRELPQSGSLTITAFAREIQDVIVLQRSIESGRWTERPINAGGAHSYGLELGAKFNLASLVASGKGTQVRLNLARYWSAVDAVPGPDNRLDSQVPYSLNVGFDHKFANQPLSWGGSLIYVQQGVVRVSSYQENFTSNQRSIEVYGTWKLSSHMLLRLAASDLLTYDQHTAVRYETTDYRQAKVTDSPSYANARLSLEMKY